MKRITFEDGGQDFYFWDIDAEGNIIDSQPFQASIWCRHRVVNHASLSPGGLAIIKPQEGGEPLTIKYRVTHIDRIKTPAPPKCEECGTELCELEVADGQCFTCMLEPKSGRKSARRPTKSR